MGGERCFIREGVSWNGEAHIQEERERPGHAEVGRQESPRIRRFTCYEENESHHSSPSRRRNVSFSSRLDPTLKHHVAWFLGGEKRAARSTDNTSPVAS